LPDTEAATDEGDLARLLLRATRAVEREMLARLALEDLGMLQMRHLAVLRALDPAGAMRASELARDAGVTRQAIAQVLVELERFGVVEQVADPRDGRAKLVRYTGSGRRGHRRAMAVFTELEREQLERLGAERVARLKRDLAALAGEPSGDRAAAAATRV